MRKLFPGTRRCDIAVRRPSRWSLPRRVSSASSPRKASHSHNTQSASHFPEHPLLTEESLIRLCFAGSPRRLDGTAGCFDRNSLEVAVPWLWAVRSSVTASTQMHMSVGLQAVCVILQQGASFRVTFLIKSDQLAVCVVAVSAY